MEQKAKKRIGVIGEHPNNDVSALIVLLNKQLSEDYELVLFPLKNMIGSNLDNFSDLKMQLSIELDKNQYEFLIIVRDLDDLATNKKEIKVKEKWFQKVNRATNGISIFFLVIYELEALMFCDLETLNTYFQTTISISGTPNTIIEPKEELRRQTQNKKRRYNPAHTIPIFEKLDIQKLYQNHTGTYSFQSFVEELKSNDILVF
jgi:hypothetical protein